MFIFFKKITLYTAVFIFIIFTTNKYAADLTRQEPISKTIFFKGKLGQNHYYEPNELFFKTGKLYKLKLVNVSDSKHYFSSNLFSQAIYTRKIQVSYNKLRVAEIKGMITEIEVWPDQEIEWWFVPDKTGIFKDFFCEF